jgi:hypothetical protein
MAQQPIAPAQTRQAVKAEKHQTQQQPDNKLSSQDAQNKNKSRREEREGVVVPGWSGFIGVHNLRGVQSDNKRERKSSPQPSSRAI